MKINQLFKAHIPDDVFLKVIEAFGYVRTTDEYSFSKLDLKRLNTLEKLGTLKEELLKYYLPCKAKLYLNTLDENKAITILRQILRLYGLILTSRQKYIKHKKTTIYSIQKKNMEDKPVVNMKIETQRRILITFD
jgi:hypothetical protein